MRKINKQKNQIIILLVLLLIMGITNYFNYYAPPKPSETVLSFSEMDGVSQQNLINQTKSKSIFDPKGSMFKEPSSEVDDKKRIVAETEENYIVSAVDSNGKLVRWKKDKIVVFVSPSEYSRVIYQALSRYNTEFEGYLKFYVTKKNQSADIVIDVVDSFDSNNIKDQVYVAGLTNNTITGQDRVLTKSHIQLLSVRPNSNQKVSKNDMYKVILHEIGHSIGIIGHSSNPKDVLFANSTVSDFSSRDINTIKIMYSGDNKLIENLTKNFADQRLKEAEKYAQLTPKKAIAWVNLAKVYYDLGKKEDAINAYKKAISLEPKNPMVYQSMGECYYTSEKYATAIEMYNRALDYSKSSQEKVAILTMIGMSYTKIDDFNQAYVYFDEAFKNDSANLSVLKNYLVACVHLNKKSEANEALEKYKTGKGLKDFSSLKDEFIEDVFLWLGK